MIEAIQTKYCLIIRKKRDYFYSVDGFRWHFAVPLTADEIRKYSEGNPAKTRYDWSKAPDWANYWTTDHSGRQDWWTDKPEPHIGTWLKKCGYTEVAFRAIKICGDYADSLEERPK